VATLAGTSYASNGDVQLAFEDLGGAGGDPLLLVMGLGASRFWWPTGFVAALAAHGFHIVAFDLRDAGESTHLTAAGGGNPIAALGRGHRSPYTAEDMTDDAVAVMEAMGWSSAHVFGHSLGGLLAQRIAIRHPAWVRSLTSSSALPSDATGVRAARYVRAGFLARVARLRFPDGEDGDIALGLALYRAIAAPGYPLDEAIAMQCIERDLAHGGLSLRDTAAQTRQSSARWTGGRLAGLRVPALVLHGADDQVLRPSAALRTAAAIPGARLAVLSGMGHFIPAELWPLYAREVRAVADLAADPAAAAKNATPAAAKLAPPAH
jgi:pimeloyl-ACP methyl ester carboxylesterase